MVMVMWQKWWLVVMTVDGDSVAVVMVVLVGEMVTKLMVIIAVILLWSFG